MTHLTTRSIMRSGTVLLLMTLLGHGMNYAFTIFMSRSLLPHEYVVLATVISLINIIGIPLQTATTVAAKYTAFIVRGYKDYLQATLLLGIGIMGVYLCAIPLLSSILRLPWQALLLVTPAILVTPSICMNIGILQGNRRLWAFSGIPSLASAIKLGAGALIIAAGYASLGALGVIVVASLISWIVSTGYVLYDRRLHKDHEHTSSHIPDQWKHSAFVILISSIAIALLGNMDMLAAKYFFTEEIASQYSVLIVISRSISYILILIPILFPAMSQVQQGIARRLLHKGLWIGGIGSAIVLVAFFLYPEQVVVLLSGSRYVAIAPYLGIAGLAAGLLSMSQLFLSYFIATDTPRIIPPLIVITILEVVGLVFFHSSIPQILTVVAATQAVLLALFIWIFLRNQRRYGST